MLNWILTPRQLCDVELLLTNGFFPLTGFLNQNDYVNVLGNMRLSNGALWPIPINLDVSEEFARQVALGENIILCDSENVPIASMVVEDKWEPDKKREAEKLFGADDSLHPAVAYLHNIAGPVYLGGKIEKLSLPTHYDFLSLRRTPAELKAFFKKNGWDKVVAFQTRNPMHRAHQELTLRAMKQQNAKLLIHPVVGMTKPGDVDYFTRVHCYQKLIKTYPKDSALLSLLPLAMRMGGPREALWHAIIRRNYGCTHLIVGRDHAGPGKNSQGESFYGPYDAQDLVKKHQDEIGITMVPFQEVAYVSNRRQYLPVDELSKEDRVLKISGTQFREMLVAGDKIPEWFSYPGIIDELQKIHPPKNKRGFCVFFTGLSGSGKSTLARALEVKLNEQVRCTLTLLDGDIVRQHLSKGLTFSKEDRDENIRRTGFVASEIVKHRGVVICAQIAPYRNVRREVRDRIAQHGGFIEVHLSTSLSVCEKRDRKGMYQKARAGIIKGFTGIDDPYELPEQAEVVVDTAKCTVQEALDQIMDAIVKEGYLSLPLPILETA